MGQPIGARVTIDGSLLNRRQNFVIMQYDTNVLASGHAPLHS